MHNNASAPDARHDADEKVGGSRTFFAYLK